MKRNESPLAEVFGYLIDDQSARAKRYRSKKLCPFNNRVPNCTKDKAKDPIGVCSIYFDSQPVITCPVRFREDWLITDDAASFFFGDGAKWSSLTEVRINDLNGKSAGNVDVILVAYDDNGTVYDFGALEVQAVYISGNIREPFESFILHPRKSKNMNWANQPNYPRPDFLSSSRKRLAPQLLFKGGIMNSWNKKIAVALDKRFFETLPPLQRINKNDADVVWLIYDLKLQKNSTGQNQFRLTKVDEVYTKFQTSLFAITTPLPGDVKEFIKLLQEKLDDQLEYAPINKMIERPF
jgi:hypothetical protein